MQPNFTSLELLKFAIMIEEEGVKFYEKYAEKSEGYNKELLSRLANDEKQHAAIFQKMYDEVKDKSGDLEYLNDFDVEAMFKGYVNHEVFNARRNEEFESIDDVLKTAALTEKITVDYYSDLLKYAKEPLKGILERLVNEEKGHHEQITKLMAI